MQMEPKKPLDTPRINVKKRGPHLVRVRARGLESVRIQVVHVRVSIGLLHKG